MRNLQQQRSNVQEKVNEANHCGEAIDDNVSGWLQDADKASQGVDTFMDEKVVKENMKCFNFSCPDFISRYQLSKQADKKAVDIKHLAENGSKIGTVSHPKENPRELELPSSMDYEDFHSRQKVFKGIVEALKDSKVNMIGVYGTGGVGKTTMVEKVGKLLKEDGIFNEVVMAVVSKDVNVRRIQGQLADNLNLTLSGETEIGRANQLWNRLDNGEKNLIILDDVWHELDLKKIGISIKAGNKRCKVVLTSRNRDVLWKYMDVDVDFHVEFLTKEEAWTLFKKKVGNHVDSHDEPRRDIAWAICKECQGLPVAINAIGAALKGKDIHAWKDALHKVENSMFKDIVGIDQKVYASLKWSYDQLQSEDVKSCFLLCCLFAENAEISIDDLVRYYMARRTLHRYQMLATLEQAFDRVRTVVDTLKRSCLLLDGKSKHLVKMHDVVRDIAISIAEDEKSFLVKHGFKDWPEKAAYEHCSVISLRLDDVRKFPDKVVCPELHTFRLDCSINRSPLQVPNEFFIGMGNPMVLELKCVIMSPLLPASLAKLAKLQMLYLNQCHLGDISILKDLKDHLEILSLRGSIIEVLPPEIGELTRLRLLDMSGCLGLGRIPKGVISKLFCLEELRTPIAFGRWGGATGASLDELMSLTRLTALRIWIPDAAFLPKDLSFENLVRFEIVISKRCFGGDFIDGGFTPTETGILTGDYDPFIYMRRDYTRPLTGTLILEDFHVANNLEFLLGKPKRSIPRNGLYPYLNDLFVKNCGMKYLFSPSCARELVGLQRLTIEDCGVMEGVLIETEKDKDEDILIIFSGLERLHLKSLPSLISFYPTMEKTATSSGSSSGHAQTVLFNDKASFPALEILEIVAVQKITEIWDKQMLTIQEIAIETPFCELSNVKIVACSNLMNVVGGCPKLEAIATGHKQKGKEVDDYHVTRFPKLKIMRLENLQNLESFCSRSISCKVLPLFDHQASFPALESLEIVAVQKITEIWDKQMLPIQEIAKKSPFCELSNLKIVDCSNLMNVVGGCPKLETIATGHKQKGKEVGDYHVTRFPKLKIMRLENLQNLESFCSRSITCEVLPLFDHQASFPALESLEIVAVQKITEIWDKQMLPIQEIATESPFCELSNLKIGTCSNLMNVVGGCPKLEAIATGHKQKGKEVGDYHVTRFPKLKIMKLENLQNLESFCSRSITCEVLPLFDHQASFPALESLEILVVLKITEIWDKQMLPIQEIATESPFCELSNLRITACSNLMNVVGGCPKLEAIATGHKQKGKEVDDYHVTRFPKLKYLMLVGLRKLESFCSRSIKCEVLPLFDHQAAFPALESLHIYFVFKITEIWDKKMLLIQETATESSFCQLSDMIIENCDKLVNVVGGCPQLEAIATGHKQKGKEVDDYHVTRFSKLKNLRLKNLQNLESFCSRSIRCQVLPLFDHQVEFPVLEVLLISFLPNITDIWDKKLRPVESFCPLLRELYVSYCEELVNVVRSNMLPQLRNLKKLFLELCTSMEVIIDLEKREEEEAQEAANNNTIIPFPELTEMNLHRLQNIKSFCIFRSGEQPVFNAQVAFPKLENLRLSSLGEIALQQLLGACELGLKQLNLHKCDEVSTMFSPHSLRSLRNVGLLDVAECEGVREVFHFDGLEVGDGQECVGPSLIQVRMVELDDLPQLTCLWNKDPRVLLDLQNLEYLTIKKCPLLANLFTASVAKALGGLKGLCLSSCSRMEEVITTDEEGHKDVIDDDDEIVFPKLERLLLEDLLNLKSFCNSNHNLNFPSLRRVVLKKCPKVHTFTSGSVHMPKIHLITSGNDGLGIEDLNKHIEQQHLKGDEEIIWGISDDYSPERVTIIL